MCYSISSTSKNIDLSKKYKKQIPDNLPENTLFHASAFSFPHLTIVTNENELSSMRWGLIPNWYKGDNFSEMASMTLNARQETIEEKPAYKNLIDQQRCIIPINGFFEYQSKNKEKIPFFVYPAKDQWFSIAGLYDHYHDFQTGTTLTTFTMVTCEANALMAEIHNTKNRMPVFLNDEGVEEWLTAPKVPLNLLKPSPENWLKAHPVNSKILSSIHHNTPEALHLFDPPRYEQGSLF